MWKNYYAHLILFLKLCLSSWPIMWWIESLFPGTCSWLDPFSSAVLKGLFRSLLLLYSCLQVVSICRFGALLLNCNFSHQQLDISLMSWIVLSVCLCGRAGLLSLMMTLSRPLYSSSFSTAQVELLKHIPNCMSKFGIERCILLHFFTKRGRLWLPLKQERDALELVLNKWTISCLVAGTPHRTVHP